MWSLKWCSCWMRLGGSRRRMLYMRYKTSWKVSWLLWNHEPCLIDLDPEHLAPATILRHCHLKPSGTLGSRTRLYNNHSNYTAPYWELTRCPSETGYR
jgi:hypothetical protein